MNLVKVVNQKKTWKGKDGKQHPTTLYFLVVGEEGKEKSIAIKPLFSNGYPLLDFIADVKIIKNDETDF